MKERSNEGRTWSMMTEDAYVVNVGSDREYEADD